MSLRRDIHVAIDEVAPPAPALPRQVTAFVLAETDTQRASSPATRSVRRRHLRGAFSMVAATLIVVLMAAVVVGPRVWRDLNASVSRPPAINQAELKKLEARPLQLPTVGAGESCPEGPFTQAPAKSHLGPVPLRGPGPVYTSEIAGREAQSLQTSWGTYLYVTYVVPYEFSGLVLIRARDLRGDQTTVFAKGNVSWQHPPAAGTPTGDAVGVDVVDGNRIQQFTELALDTGRMHADSPGWWRYEITLQGFARGSSLCIGYQVDGPAFTETFVAYYG